MSASIPASSFISPAEYAERHGYPLRTVQNMILDGRVKAVRIGNKAWAIPACEAAKPAPMGWAWRRRKALPVGVESAATT